MILKVEQLDGGSNEDEGASLRKQAIWLAAAALGVVAVMAHRESAPFDPYQWGSGAYSVRGGVRHDLYVKAMDRLPAGTHRAKVRDLLGPADGAAYSTDSTMDSYVLGLPSEGTETEELIIKYDDAGRVTRWWIARVPAAAYARVPRSW